MRAGGGDPAVRILNSIRHHSWVSAFARRALGPVRSLCRFVADQIEKKVWINGGRVVLDGIELRFPRDVGVMTATTIHWRRSYEINTWRALKSLLPEARHFIDAGSHVGIFSVLAKKLNPDLEVDAFEPIPSLHEKNVRFHRRNGIRDNRIHQLALGETPGEATLLIPQDPLQIEEVSAATLRPDSWQAGKDFTRRIEVAVSTLDAHFAERAVGRPLVIKVDVEDFEAALLRGGRQMLAEHRPLIVCEILPREHRNWETLDLLRECSYAAFALTDWGVYRVLAEDFAPERRPLEFLLAPLELVAAERNFLPYEELAPQLLAGRDRV